MSASDPAMQRACARCFSVLDIFQPPTGPIRWLHPRRLTDYDHEPEPVPLDQVTHVARTCDLCGDPYPIHRYTTATTIRVVGPDALHDYGQAWLACIDCSVLMQRQALDRLVRRAVEAVRPADAALAAGAIRPLHASILANLLPGRELVTDTNWPPATIVAGNLPRIRDRLAALLAGDDTIADLFTADEQAAVTAGLGRAPLYWVDEEFTDLTRHAALQLPTDEAPAANDAPSSDGLLVWASPVSDRDRVCAVAWTRTYDTLTLTFLRSIGGEHPAGTMQQLRETVGWLAPTKAVHIGQSGSGAYPAVRATQATWLLIAQRLASVTVTPLDSAVRKAYARARRPAPEVRLVSIRPQPRTPAAAGEPGAGEGERRARTGRWWVSGFWRSQPYGPGRSHRRLIYISPHLRGPADLPINTATTVRVLRSPARPQASNS